MIRQALLIALTVLLTPLVYGAAIRVPADQPTIQQGIDVAVSGDTVLIADGSYTGPSNRDLSFHGKAIVVKSENGPFGCIIDCENASRGVSFTANETRQSRLQDITIRNAYHETQDSGDPLDWGGGIVCRVSAPTIAGCIIESNTVTSYGGGISCSGGDALITGCIIFGNYAGYGGGGINIHECDAAVSDCVIASNIAEFSWGGGGISTNYCESDVLNCLLIDNQAHNESGGGGISATYPGILIKNCTFSGNSAYYGGALSIYQSESALVNSILWADQSPNGNEIGIIPYPSMESSLGVNHCIVQGGAAGVYLVDESSLFWGAGNLESDPTFAGGALGGYYLAAIAAGQSADSPCIDSGSEPADAICFEAAQGQACLNQRTTRTDVATDSGTVDIGFHYPIDFSVPPTPTATPTPIYSPTPIPTVGAGVTLMLNNAVFAAGDPFRLRAMCLIAQETLDVDLYVVLDVMGSYWFWPDWTTAPKGSRSTLHRDRVNYYFILDFVWPEGDYGAYDNLMFWGGMIDPSSSQVVGSIDSVSFGYR